MEDKITKEGQSCKKCQTPVVLVVNTRKSPKKKNKGYYTSWLKCPQCKTIYFDETKHVYTKLPNHKRIESPVLAWLPINKPDGSPGWRPLKNWQEVIRFQGLCQIKSEYLREFQTLIHSLKSANNY